MSEVNPASPDQSQEVGAVLGRVLYHALQGRCFSNRSLPEEHFFLDYILSRLGSENFTVGGKCTSETQKTFRRRSTQTAAGRVITQKPGKPQSR